MPRSVPSYVRAPLPARWARVVAVLLLGALGSGCSSRAASPGAALSRAEPDVDAGDGDAASSSGGPVSIAVSPLSLVPPFDPSTHDYYVRCQAGENPLTLTLEAPPGGAMGVVQPVVTERVRAGAVAVTVAENDAVVVEASADGGSDAYWIRCLPHDFPTFEMTTADAGSPSAPGYYLLGGVVEIPADGPYAMVVDEHGVPVWYGASATGVSAVDVDSLAPGVVSFVPYIEFTFGEATTSFELHDVGGGATSYVASAFVPLDIHELRLLSNGDYLVLANPITLDVDLTGLPGLGPGENMVDCVIQEVSAAGGVVWSWRASDHFDAVLDSTVPATGSADGVPFVDVFHCNSIDVAPDGDLLVSARNMDSVFLVSKATGAVLWKMGGSAYTRDDAPFLAVAGGPSALFYRQHDARFLPDGSISIFDDETATSNPARAAVYSLDVAAQQATLTWQYAGSMSSVAMGSFRVAPDGTRLIGWGVTNWSPTGPPSPAFTELDRSGTVLREFTYLDGNASYRAVKVDASELSLSAMRATAGTP